MPQLNRRKKLSSQSIVKQVKLTQTRRHMEIPSFIIFPTQIIYPIVDSVTSIAQLRATKACDGAHNVLKLTNWSINCCNMCALLIPFPWWYVPTLLASFGFPRMSSLIIPRPKSINFIRRRRKERERLPFGKLAFWFRSVSYLYLSIPTVSPMVRSWRLILREIHARPVIHLDTRCVSWHALLASFFLFIGFGRLLVPSQHTREGLDRTQWTASHPLTWICLLLLDVVGRLFDCATLGCLTQWWIFVRLWLVWMLNDYVFTAIDYETHKSCILPPGHSRTGGKKKKKKQNLLKDK